MNALHNELMPRKYDGELLMRPPSAGSFSFARIAAKSSAGGFAEYPAMLRPPRSINSISMRAFTALAASSAVCTAFAVVILLRGLHAMPRIFSGLSAAIAVGPTADTKPAAPAAPKNFLRVICLLIRHSFRVVGLVSWRGVNQPHAAQNHQHAADGFHDGDAF